MRPLVVRLPPGADLRSELLELAERERVGAGWVMTCVGSLKRVRLRLAGAAGHADLLGAFEIVALTGTLELDGGHLHLAVADENGQTLGGHLAEGCVVRTTAEIVLAVDDRLQFAREPDPATGYDELVIRDTKWTERGEPMIRADFPAPAEGFVLTHFIVAADVARSRDFYVGVLGGTVVLEGEPTIVKLANGWVTINVGGGPTDDKPRVVLGPPRDLNRVSAFLNIRVADIHAVYEEWRSRGAEFLTPPKDHGHEIRCYMRDPDGHLIEVGQSTGILERM
jgi:predicted DNA-binding protein with PD1-like motif/catechol 2,3-dioxygenase-like lactoylglutathione lyase family enzyme